ncbi:MAG TPA: prepilin-type N-terminal cleavage/methylation domain-containing protein [Nitrospira sp.]|nr:prepilin-type N-terminal cleavage/methylation domain-containing protein [Nitrospira sp.]
MKNDGFSLIEVMVAMVIAGVALMGTLGAVEVSSRHVQQGGLNSKAIELAQARLEAKRSIRWQSILEDDLDRDGIPETFMADDGQGSDITADDGIYTAMFKRDGVTVVWMIEAERPGPLFSAAVVMIRAVASYPGPNGHKKEVQVATIRANPNFVGER